jgi:hypothetical protein
MDEQVEHWLVEDDDVDDDVAVGTHHARKGAGALPIRSRHFRVGAGGSSAVGSLFGPCCIPRRTHCDDHSVCRVLKQARAC